MKEGKKLESTLPWLVLCTVCCIYVPTVAVADRTAYTLPVERHVSGDGVIINGEFSNGSPIGGKQLISLRAVPS